MKRQRNKLTAVQVKSIKKAGRHSDGGGLYLIVKPSGARSWSFLYRRGNKRTEIGLGNALDVSLSHARKKALEYRLMLNDGLDPLTEKNKSKSQLKFIDAANQLFDSVKSSWRNQKTAYKWRLSIDTYCKPLHHKAASQVTTEDVLTILKPIWTEKPETASKVRNHLEQILDYAKAKEGHNKDNPARLRGHLDKILPKRSKATKSNYSAMPYNDVPAFIAELQGSDAPSVLALQLTILTACRTGEVLKARWSEIDFENALWTIPAERYKTQIKHEVPLTDGMISILRKMEAFRQNEYVFFGGKPNSHLSDMSMTMVMRKRGKSDFAVHGFRSSFRDWAGDKTDFTFEIAEAALGHKVGNSVTQAYRRGTALEKRRQLMEKWESFCMAKPADVVRLHG